MCYVSFLLDEAPSWLKRTEAKLHVDGGSGALEDTKGAHNLRWHAVVGLVDLEVLQRPLRLGTPVAVGLDLDLAERIALCPGGGSSRHGVG